MALSFSDQTFLETVAQEIGITAEELADYAVRKYLAEVAAKRGE